AGFLRRSLSQKLNLRITPELSFHEDKSIEHGAKIAKILNSIEITPDTDKGEEE
ncbi:MAG: ribosome-binding factor A, partial [Clostridia bacterium]|nr:ribosome-binding factor A [Clostridia bacterium]